MTMLLTVSIDAARGVFWGGFFSQARTDLTDELRPSCGNNSEEIADAILIGAQAVVTANLTDIEMRLAAMETSIRDPAFIARTLAGMSEGDQGRVLVLYDAIKQAGK